MAETELERAEKRFAQARARLQALRNREATKQRKLDTRRKVILGGALVDLAVRDDNAAAMLDRLIRNLAREQDRSAFTGWDWREAGSGGAVAEEAGAAGADGDARAEDVSARAQRVAGIVSPAGAASPALSAVATRS
ncbi:mobilization protein [Amaricoccus sp. W119]|uniref:mobilization protein n=1 Tax=Amaricoccus sp. W119 TaxID=3391833 RepID=UPI0039A5AF0B